MLGEVTLTSAEIHLACVEASMRHARGRGRGLQQGNGYRWDLRSHGMDINGVCGELAFCKLLNLYWHPGTGPAPCADIGPYQIKTTHHPEGKLVILPNCHNDICVLMVGCEEHFRCAGWIPAEEGRSLPFFYSLHDGRPATYNLPQDFLNPFSSLPR